MLKQDGALWFFSLESAESAQYWETIPDFVFGLRATKKHETMEGLGGSLIDRHTGLHWVRFVISNDFFIHQ